MLNHTLNRIFPVIYDIKIPKNSISDMELKSLNLQVKESLNFNLVNPIALNIQRISNAIL